MMKKKWLLPGVLLILAVLIAGFRTADKGGLRAQASEQEGQPIPAPEFTLTNILDGERYSLSDLRGQVVLVNFWATWCPPCRREIPDLSRIYTNYKDDGVIVLGISLDNLQSNQIRTFAENYKISYPVLHGTQTELGSISRAYGGIEAIPTTFLVDREGHIQEMYVGARSERTFMEDISKHL